ncbi:peptidase dimerization domain-containing protein [Amycolatopsis sp. PS_44_ISF1]|uniref:peptidase dimerization domain-containing protein n=1 Tax=Amycolatopsis sp. PS_44_ISF1 TaxID=2974917 RepID=UPI0028DE885D|nr:peptidase dimerization domain-containing protein [Amycolatopsis sp. PS_44_ISF1]MDT8914925.1 amidohydrolase [Amycolatopsis sp. PS_44_ISF1]
MESDEVRHERVDQEIERLDERLRSLAGELHAHPEPAGQEHFAADRLTAGLAAEGFDVRRGVADRPTAFTARYGTGRPCVALLLAYDAPPGSGHTRGHNLVAAAGFGAALAARRVLAGDSGSLLVAGAPAEEPALARAGVFDEVDAALVFHPGAHSWSWTPLAARAELRMAFHGRAAGLSAPEPGVDALAALVQAFTAVAALRARLSPGSRVQGIVTHGGEATDVVPDLAEGRFGLYARTAAELEALVADVTAAAEGAALSTGTKVELERLADSSHFRDNPVLSARFSHHLAAHGIHTTPPDPEVFADGSGVGEVSVRVPSIHPQIAILDPRHADRTPEFAAAAVSSRGRAVLLAAAAALARTAVDLLAHPALVFQAWSGFTDQARAERTGR